MIYQWDVISYIDLCKEEGVSLQRWMNFRINWKDSIILMSLRPSAQYADRVEENWKILIYEGHNIQKNYFLILHSTLQFFQTFLNPLDRNMIFPFTCKF